MDRNKIDLNNCKNCGSVHVSVYYIHDVCRIKCQSCNLVVDGVTLTKASRKWNKGVQL